ncbi:MAG: hypothetical protein KDC35_09525 [Acidobacteria bacterium]|nr:hypothetical protein [Acidobacteriota bacterium]
MFKLLGAVVALYAFYALSQGEVYAKSGMWGKQVSRDEQPISFWSTVVIYFVLAAFLMVFF